MAAKPPPLPEITFQRVVKTARFEGYSIMVIAGVSALWCAAGGDFIVPFFACLAVGTGAMEVHGVQMLERGDDNGMNWLVRAQMFLLLVLLGYATYRITHFEPAFIQEKIAEFRLRTGEVSKSMGTENPYDVFSDQQLFLYGKALYFICYTALGIVSCIYQGFMARYYHKRREAIAQALGFEDEF